MKPIQPICNEGCNKQFDITEMPTVELEGGIEKTFFTCTHCQHEYVAFYTDNEIRKLQDKIRKVQKRFANTNYDHKVAAKQEAKIKKEIKLRMDDLRRSPCIT
jgi:tyrosine-protein phosphatase YwqE